MNCVIRCRVVTRATLAVLATLSVGLSATVAAEVAVSMTPKWSILRRPAGEKAWQPVAENQPLPAEEMLLGLSGAKLNSANKAVHLSFHTDLSGLSPFPIVESAVILHEDPKADLDVTLDRGRIDLSNHKPSGDAFIHLRVRDATWELALIGPGSRVAVEEYGRWPRGTTFSKEPDPKNVPTTSLIFVVLKGEATLTHGGTTQALKAPPGPALMEWDSVSGQDESPRKLDKLPAWAELAAEQTPEAKEKLARRDRLVKLAEEKGLDGALDEFLASDDPGDRRLAVMALGALDDLPRLGKTLRETKHHDVWDNGVLAIRHWIGRGPGQDQVLYKGLLNAGYSEVHAETVLQLLHSFGDDDLARPDTYQTLIAFLNHDKLAIRGLAYWHLVRLVPAGKEIGYNPWDDAAARAEAVSKWKKLIPRGMVPPRPGSRAPKK